MKRIREFENDKSRWFSFFVCQYQHKLCNDCSRIITGLYDFGTFHFSDTLFFSTQNSFKYLIQELVLCQNRRIYTCSRVLCSDHKYFWVSPILSRSLFSTGFLRCHKIPFIFPLLLQTKKIVTSFICISKYKSITLTVSHFNQGPLKTLESWTSIRCHLLFQSKLRRGAKFSDHFLRRLCQKALSFRIVRSWKLVHIWDMFKNCGK